MGAAALVDSDDSDEDSDVEMADEHEGNEDGEDPADVASQLHERLEQLHRTAEDASAKATQFARKAAQAAAEASHVRAQLQRARVDAACMQREVDGETALDDGETAGGGGGLAGGGCGGRQRNADEAQEPTAVRAETIWTMLNAVPGVDMPPLPDRAAHRWFERDAAQMKPRSQDRVDLIKVMRGLIDGVGGALNPNVEATRKLALEALQSGTESNQKSAADAHVAASVVASYRDACTRKAGKREQRQILSALAPRKGRQGYTRELLRKEHGLALTKFEWRAVRLHSLHGFPCAVRRRCSSDLCASPPMSSKPEAPSRFTGPRPLS